METRALNFCFVRREISGVKGLHSYSTSRSSVAESVIEIYVQQSCCSMPMGAMQPVNYVLPSSFVQLYRDPELEGSIELTSRYKLTAL
jgi:hypothetical protein